MIKKINIVSNEHLRNGNLGWMPISNGLKLFNTNDGINCYEWLDKEIKEKKIEGYWMGFLHNTITYPKSEYPLKYKNKILSLSELIYDEYFLDKLCTCEKIFVFTQQIKDYLQNKLNFEKIYLLHHPANITRNTWIKNDHLLHVGQQLRKFHSYLNLTSHYKKLFLQPHKKISFDMDPDIEEMKRYSDNSNIVYVSRLNNDEYLNLMCRSVVFLDLYDVAACNTIIECISMNVPVAVNKLPGCVEYLGEDYPLYFSNLYEAEKKIHDEKLIKDTNLYLKSLNKDFLNIQKFFEKFYKHCSFKYN